MRKPEYAPGRTKFSFGKIGTDDRRFVGNCPFRYMQIPAPCDSVPEEFVCNTPDCFSMGENMKVVDWSKLEQSDLDEFARAIVLVQPDVMERLINCYIAKQNLPARP
jgi:hypothetical protein